MWNNAIALRRIANAGFCLALALLLGAAIWRVAHLDVFAIRAIDVVGDVTHVTREQVRNIAANELKGSYFIVDLHGARQAFEKLPWVRRVDVRRRWPYRLEFAVEEHRELARWGSSALINTQGEIFEGASNQSLPVFIGPEGSHREISRLYLHFNELLAQIGRRVESIRVSERRAWQLRLDDRTVIELGRDALSERLAGFVKVYGRSVATMKTTAHYVDLRYANGFAVRVRDLERSETQA